MRDSLYIPLIAFISFLSLIFCIMNPVYAENEWGNTGLLSTQYLSPIGTHSSVFELYQAKKDSVASSTQKKIYLTFRMGLGSSAHLGESSQIAIGMKPNKIPVMFSFVSESYRKSPLKKEYAKPYDTFINAINLLYMPNQPLEKRITFFVGGGFGRIELEKYERSNDLDWRQKPFAVDNGFVSNLELGFHLKLIWKLGFYGEGKYIYAKKKKNGENLIDANSSAWMVGLTLNFGFFD